MDTSKLEKFCLSITDPADTNALLAGVRQRGMLLRIDPEGPQVPADADAVDGRLLTQAEKAQRAELLAEVDGSPARYAEVVRHAAYSWFNRVAAIRYMELHDFLPTHVRMLSRPGTPDGVWARPQCLDEAPYLDLPGLDRDEVARLADGAHDEELFRLLLIAQCEQLAQVMPGVFGQVSTSEALLLPDRLLGEAGLVRRMVCELGEEVWGSEEPDASGRVDNQAEITGWLYQFYVARDKDDAFDSFKKGKKATPEKIGPATQLFTPKWIVRYMVQNSLGRLWMLNNPTSKLAEKMEFYIAPEEGDAAAQADFVHIDGPEDISFCDPACGSAHILACAFDLLVEMYRERGYRDRDAARLILEKNLHGMEIDERAAQVAELVLNMRACSLDRRFFTRDNRPRPDVCVLKPVEIDAGELPGGVRLADNKRLLDALAHLTECGSLLAPGADDLAQLREALEACQGSVLYQQVAAQLEQAIDMCEHLCRTHDVVVANPPYMGSSNFDPWTSSWVKANYPDVKSDLCTCFIERGFSLARHEGYSAMVTMQSWMFLGSFEKMREKLLASATIISMCHLGARAFDAIGGEVVATTATVFQNAHVPGKGAYLRLVDLIGSDVKRKAALEAIQNPACGWFYRADASTFKDIPGTPIAYWASEAMRRAFNSSKLGEFASTSLGMATCDNERFLRLWWEVSNSLRSIPDTEIDFSKKWFPYNKGGHFRKWYGNDDYLLNWANHGAEVQSVSTAIGNINRFFHPMLSWTRVSSSCLHVRYKPAGYFYDMTGPAAVSQDIVLLFFCLGYLNSSTCTEFASYLSASLDYQPGQVASYPLIRTDASVEHQVSETTNLNCRLSQSDYDSFETSWDFKRHPLL